MSNPVDIARLGHRFQIYAEHTTSTEERVVSRLQRFEPSIRQDTTIYHEIGTVDPVGFSSEPPQHTITMEEYLHNAQLDLVLAGKDPDVATSWNLGDYNVGNGPLNLYLLERNNSGVLQGELKFTGGMISEIQWSWQMGQPITSRYTVLARIGQHFVPASAPHGTWAAQNTSSPGGIRIKDARLYLGGSTDGLRVYRLQGFTVRVVWRTVVVNEAGNRQMVGILAEPPDTTLDLDIAWADPQPDDTLYVTQSSSYYDYQNANELTGSAIRVFSPTAAEGATVLRAWVLEKLITATAQPATIAVRGLASKRYSLMLHKVTTAGSGGLLCYSGDIPSPPPP